MLHPPHPGARGRHRPTTHAGARLHRPAREGAESASAIWRTGNRVSAISTVAAWGMSAGGISAAASPPRRRPSSAMRVPRSVRSFRPSRSTRHSSRPSENAPLSVRPVASPVALKSCTTSDISDRPQRPPRRGVRMSASAVGPPMPSVNAPKSPRVCRIRSRSKSSKLPTMSRPPRAKPSPSRPVRPMEERPSHRPSAPSISSSSTASAASDIVSTASAPVPSKNRRFAASASSLVVTSRSERHVPETVPPPMASRSGPLSIAAGSGASKS